MSFSKKFRAKSFTEAREVITADDAVPTYVADAVRELAAHAPHLGPNAEAGEVDGMEIEVAVSGHVDASSFQVNIGIQFVAAAAASKKSR